MAFIIKQEKYQEIIWKLLLFELKPALLSLYFLTFFFYILKHGFGLVKLSGLSRNGPKGSTDIKLGCFAQFASSSSPN